MKLKTERFEFKNGKSLLVSQENWDISMTLSEMHRTAEEKPLDDKRKQYFRSVIYPVLAAPSSGDVPDLDEAYIMLEKYPKDIDGWYTTVQSVNPDWFVYIGHNKSETFTFSDKTKIVIHDGNIPSMMMKIRDLEELSIENPMDNISKQVFRSTFYPKLAAFCTGDVPDEETARSMPINELNAWYELVNKINPHLFKTMRELKEEVDAEKLKKKRRKRGK